MCGPRMRSNPSKGAPLQGLSMPRTIRGMLRTVGAIACALALVGVAVAADSLRTIEGNGISLRVPTEWVRVVRADAGSVAEPHTFLVAATQGVRPIETDCLASSYRVPADGAAVVVIGWKRKLSTHYVGGRENLFVRELERGYFDCFAGRGIAAQIDLDGRTYQVNVLVGDRADRSTMVDALAAARSLAVSG
jgi:hypothetical protein